MDVNMPGISREDLPSSVDWAITRHSWLDGRLVMLTTADEQRPGLLMTDVIRTLFNECLDDETIEHGDLPAMFAALMIDHGVSEIAVTNALKKARAAAKEKAS